MIACLCEEGLITKRAGRTFSCLTLVAGAFPAAAVDLPALAVLALLVLAAALVALGFVAPAALARLVDGAARLRVVEAAARWKRRDVQVM